jgi:hypothetical protein
LVNIDPSLHLLFLAAPGTVQLQQLAPSRQEPGDPNGDGLIA